jgi:hypothetical protein
MNRLSLILVGMVPLLTVVVVMNLRSPTPTHALVSKPPATATAKPGSASNLDQQPWHLTIDPPTRMVKGSMLLLRSPSFDNAALQLNLLSGDPYTSPHFYTTVTNYSSSASQFTLSLQFRFSDTSMANCGSPSPVQALEFVMGKRVKQVWWEWAVQWMNVGPGANGCADRPRWRIWNGSPSEPKWSDIGLEQPLAPNTWHSLQMTGSIRNGQVFYETMTINNITVRIMQGFAPVANPNAPDELAVAVQPDGNYRDDSYSVMVDKVTLQWK